MRLVLDTDVIRSGLQSPYGASRLLLCGISEGAFRPLVTQSMLLEHEDVLKRPTSLVATGMTLATVDAFLDGYLQRAERVVIHRRIRPAVRDPMDDVFAEALLNGNGDAVVTFNRRDYLDVDPRLASKGRMAVPTMVPGEALGRLAWRPTATTPFTFPRR